MGTFTLSQLETRTWDQLDSNTGEFPEPNVRAVLNQGLYRMNNLFGFSQATVPVPGFSIQNQLVYANSPGILIPLSLDFEGQRMEPFTQKRLAREHRNFATDTGNPQRWVRWGLKNFLLHPADSYGGGFLEMTGVANLIPLVNPNDTCLLEDWHVEIVINWAKASLLLKEGGKAFADASIVFQKMFMQARTKSLWTGIKFPKYWILKTQDDGKGTVAGVPVPQATQ